jgi:hypothetical protein
MFGDETSFASAASLVASRGAASSLRFVFEVSSAAESSGIVNSLRLGETSVVEKTNGAAHLIKVEEYLRATLTPESTLVLTGNAQSIQHLRAQLKLRQASHAGQKVKAYWAVGKQGLD